MRSRILEPEVMDEPNEVLEYDQMDHREVNRLFVDDFLEQALSCERFVQSSRPAILDLGTGTALIPQVLISKESRCHVTAIDKGANMIAFARKRLEENGQSNRIDAQVADSCHLSFDENSFDAIISNSLVHHLAEPIDCFKEAVRVLRPRGLFFFRDLLRLETEEEIEQIVAQYAANETAAQQQLLHQSLQAALTIEELTSMLKNLPQLKTKLHQTSDRHWTLTAIHQ